MNREDILNPNNWKDGVFEESIDSSTVKYLNEKASFIHSLIESMNEVLIEEKFVASTVITETNKGSLYTLKIKISHYKKDDKCKHKENSHKQRVNI